MKSFRFTLTCLLLAVAAAASAQDWPNWRGPHYNGASDEVNLPVKFSPTEGVKWATDLPGPSAATPVIWKDTILLSSTDPATEQLVAMCLDRKTGKVLWRHNVGSGYKPAGLGTSLQLDSRAVYSSASPVTDGQHAIFYYGNGDLVAFDFKGKRLWDRNIQRDYGDYNFGWTYSSSPLLYEGRLYIQVLQRDIPVSGRGRQGAEPYLLALNPATGKELWRVVRPSQAKMESRESFNTPTPFVHNGRKELLLAGGRDVTGHDPATGKELWRWGPYYPDPNHQTMRLVPSVVTGDGMILVCAPKKDPVYAIKAGGNGDVSATGLAWKSEQDGPVTTDVATPLFYKKRFYVLSDVRKNLSCVQASDGKVLWTTPTPGFAMCWGSPTGADGKVYVISLTGEVHVFDAETGQILATNPMAEQEREIRSSVAVANGNLFIRTNSKLYCIGK